MSSTLVPGLSDWMLGWITLATVAVIAGLLVWAFLSLLNSLLP